MGLIGCHLPVAFRTGPILRHAKCIYCDGENHRSKDSAFCSDSCRETFHEELSKSSIKTEEIELPLYEGC